jgi:hypothetical protein
MKGEERKKLEEKVKEKRELKKIVSCNTRRRSKMWRRE